MNLKTILLIILSFVIVSCTKSGSTDLVKNNFEFAEQQFTYAFTEIEAAKQDDKFSPRTINKDGELELVVARDWTSGFFPGSLWYMYEYTGDKKWEEAARKFTAPIEPQQFTTTTHDLGFILNNSFGNGLRLTGDESYKPILMQAAKSLISRYKPGAKVIRSWDFSQDKWQCPVIDYDTITGEVRNRHTHQGLAHESTWARGEAWALYGYTMCYRETGDTKYLEQADRIVDFIFNNPNLPNDLVPYWDYDAPDIPNESRDVSAATIAASALYELSTFNYQRAEQYKSWADTILDNVTSSYRATLNSDRGFLLLHSTGSKPSNSEVDVPLSYADYYFIEALIRKDKLENNKPLH